MILDNNASEGRTIRRYGSNIAERGGGERAQGARRSNAFVRHKNTISVESVWNGLKRGREYDNE